MLKKYIQDITKHEVRKILLSNYKEKLVFEVKQNQELKEENKHLKDQLLSNDYYEIVKENKKLKKENEILERSYNFISNNTLPELESRVTSKERIATEINLMLNKEKQKVEDLKQENKKLKEAIENLEGELILKSNLLSEQKEEKLKLKNLYSKEKLEKNKLLFNGYGERYEKDVLLKQISEQYEEIEKLKQENEQLKNLSCAIVVDNDGKLDSLFNKQLRKENEQLKEAIEKLDGKLILKGNLLSESKQENEKLKNILTEIYEITDSTWGVKLPYFEVRSLLNKIREISVNR